MCSASEKENLPLLPIKGPPAQRPDIVLIEEANSGDPDSFSELCRRYYPAMVAIAHSLVGDRHLAEDAAQQAFAKAAEKLPQLKKKSQFAGWLAAICRNAAKDIARSTKLLHSTDDVSMIADETHENGVNETVKEALSKLSASAREVIFLRYYDGMSYEQISAVLGISEQAINGRLRRAKKKLADYLRRKGFG
jgi:RNA polymerase sigma-70 factor (ECF subfamily)